MIVLYIVSAIIASIVVFMLIIILRTLFLITQRPIEHLYKRRSSESNYSKYNEWPYKTIDIVLALEDARFFNHHGYDIDAMKRAFRRNLRERRVVFGGSTITQQLAKNLYLNFDRQISRKLIELFISIYIERKLSKIEILELYLNVIYYGNNQYGIYNASKFYFNKECRDLSINQIFLLLCTLSTPTVANPLVNQEKFFKIKNTKLCQVLWTGNDKKYISLIENYGPDNLDPDLQKHDIINNDNVRMSNEEYGPKVYK